jgi:hypothetical protein
MSRLDVSQLSARHQKQVGSLLRKSAKSAERNTKPRAPKPTGFGFEFDSKLELEYATHLELLAKAGEIEEWLYHPIRVRLAKNCTYEPDFGVWREGNHLTLYEVKGSWLAKNARDSRTRLLIAASMYLRWRWVAVLKDTGRWAYEVMNPIDEAPAV